VCHLRAVTASGVREPITELDGLAFVDHPVDVLGRGVELVELVGHASHLSDVSE